LEAGPFFTKNDISGVWRISWGHTIIFAHELTLLST